jgi:hypothetical protein
MSDAAEIAGVSYATVYRAVQAETVRSEQAPNGVITIARADVRKIRKRKLAKREVVAIMVRPKIKQWKRWKRAAGDSSITAWLVALADKAAAKV